MSRCTGHCCKKFPLPCTPEELKENYRAWVNSEPQDKNGREMIAEIWLIAPMVRKIAERDIGAYYTCAHHQPNGDCAIYDIRPRMCSEYPYGNPCEHIDKGCTMLPVIQ